MHGTRTANCSPAGRPKGQGVIQPFLDIIKSFQYCQVFPNKGDFEFLEIRFFIIIRIKAKDIKNDFNVHVQEFSLSLCGLYDVWHRESPLDFVVSAQSNEKGARGL